jgi:arsenate reductase (glutaredoxin)
VPDVEIFHNPKCSKSRRAMEILATRGVDAEVVQYLKTPPDRATVERIVDAIDDDPGALVRRDARFKELGLGSADCETREQVIDLLVDHPALMERPVVLVGNRGVIARPPEKLLDLIG